MRIILTILTTIFPMLLFAEATSDRIVANADGMLKPGGDEVMVTISLEGSRMYTGYQMDITLPQGVELNYYQGEPDVAMYNADDCIYPYTTDRGGNKTFTHSVTATYGEVASKTIRIMCSSNSNQNFKTESGKLLTIYLKASLFAKPGDISLGLSNCKFATFDSNTMQTTGYVPGQTAINGIAIGSNATTSLAIASDVKWGTLMLPFATSLPKTMKAYTCNSNDGDNLILNPTSRIEAFTPYIIYCEQGLSEELTGSINAEAYPQSEIVTAGYLSASVNTQILTEGYVMQKQGSDVQFHKIGNDNPIVVPSGKCWAMMPQHQSAKTSFGIIIDNTAGISSLKEATTAEDSYYTVDGKKLVQPQGKGLYIHNGKKFTR